MLATIEIVKEITAHPNADSLEFVKVLGYKCIVRKDFYSVGEKVILIQPDTVLPDLPWTELYKKLSKTRVRAIKLRNEWSFGIVEKVSLLEHPEMYAVGDEVSQELNITKYEPPLPADIQALGALPSFLRPTDEERYQNIQLDLYQNNIVDVTLKVDGSSVTYYYNNGAVGVTGRNYEIKPDAINKYTNPITQYNIFQKLEYYGKKYNLNFAVRGELYGKGIQSANNNPHSKLNNNVAFFNTFLIDEFENAGLGHQYYFRNVCDELDLPTVNILESNVLLTDSLIKKYDEELTQISGSAFEGVVIKGNNFSFKIINKYYDSKK